MSARIVIELTRSAKRKLKRGSQRSRDARFRTRCQIVLMYADGKGASIIAAALGCATSTATRVARRFQELGEAALLDGRNESRASKVTDDHAALLADLLEGSPETFGWRRPTWTRELLAATMEAATGETFSLTTVSRLLRKLGARKGRPRPVVNCPWSKRKREARLRRIRKFLATLPEEEAAVYEDEVDIHLNPKIGADWMLPGRQKAVVTPGRNVKRYVAGALDARTGEVAFVEGERKSSPLFIALLRHLAQDVYPEAERLHVICDNYSVHSSNRTQAAVAQYEGRIVIHFLPPYCPQGNPIERLWGDLHDNVTRNHRCKTIEHLMDCVRRYLGDASPFPGSKPALARAS